MKHKIALLLFLIFPIASCDLDFSQFYLPPCCHISPQGSHYTGYASNRASTNTKREVSSHKTSGIVKNYAGVKDTKIEQRHFNKSSTTQLDFTKSSKKSLKSYDRQKIYKIVVPLEEIIVKSQPKFNAKHETKAAGSSTTQRPETSLKPPTMGKILVPEMKSESPDPSKFKRNSNNAMSKVKLLEEVITSELEGAESQRSYTGKKSLMHDDENQLEPEHQIVLLESESKLSPSEYRLVSQETGYVDIENVATESHSHTVITNTSSGNLVKRQTPRKMPTTWLTNLRRALYQSVTAIDKTQDNVRNDQPTELQNLSKETIRFPETWNNIQVAPVQYVNKMAEVSSGPHQIFLPRGQGPVASGVLVNTRNVGLQIRVATELHNPINQQSGCSCYLLNHGEIPVAYWAVTRVINQQGRAALQYLVHPLPHSVPTPPEMHSMGSGDPMFDPSPIDPFTNFYENNNRQHIESHPQQIGPSPHNGNHIEKELGHSMPHMPPVPPPPQKFFDGPRNPKFIHELPNGHHRIEIYDDSFKPQPSPMPAGFTRHLPQQHDQVNHQPYVGPNDRHQFPPPQLPQPEFQQGPPQPHQSEFQHGPPPQQNEFPQGPPPQQNEFQQGPPPPQNDFPQGPPPQQNEFQQGPSPPQNDFPQGPPPQQNEFQRGPPPPHNEFPQEPLPLRQNEFQQEQPAPFLDNNDNEQVFLPPVAPNPTIGQISDLELYRNIAQSNFQNQINQNNLLSGTPPFNEVNVLNSQLPSSPGPAPVPFQGFLPPVPPTPTQFIIPLNQAQQLPINPTNVGPTQFTIPSGDQLSKPPTFPKSIQEIISPYALSPNPQGQGQFITNPNSQGNRQQEELQNNLQNNKLNSNIRPNNNNNNGQDDSKDSNEDVTGDLHPPSSFHSTSRPSFNNDDKYKADRNRPYIVSNVLDNERKYYPVRKPYKVAYSKDYYVRRPAYHRRRTVHSRYQNIDDKRGYILNF